MFFSTSSYRLFQRVREGYPVCPTVTLDDKYQRQSEQACAVVAPGVDFSADGFQYRHRDERGKSAVVVSFKFTEYVMRKKIGYPFTGLQCNIAHKPVAYDYISVTGINMVALDEPDVIVGWLPDSNPASCFTR